MRCRIAIVWVAIAGTMVAPNATRADASSHLLSLAVDGWRANRARLTSGSGIVYVDFEHPDGRSPSGGRAIRFMFEGQRARFEPYVISYSEQRSPASPLPPLDEQNREVLHVEFGEGCIHRVFVESAEKNTAYINPPGISEAHRLYDTVSLGQLTGRLPEMVEESESRTAVKETVDGRRLIRIDTTKLLTEGGPTSTCSVWLDPAKGYAAVRQEYASGAGHRTSIRNELRRVEGGAWFPVITDIRSYHLDDSGKSVNWYHGRYVFRDDFAFNVDVEDRWFTLATIIEPGGTVRDLRYHPAISHKYAPPLEDEVLETYLAEVRQAIETETVAIVKDETEPAQPAGPAASRDTTAEEEPPHDSHEPRGGLIALAAVGSSLLVALGVVTWVLVRRRARTSSP